MTTISTHCVLRRATAAVVLAASFLATGAAAQTACNGALRKVNVGVSVSPPNVVHTAAYVAKELGIFARHCIDANIIQFDGGAVIVAAVDRPAKRAEQFPRGTHALVLQSRPTPRHAKHQS